VAPPAISDEALHHVGGRGGVAGAAHGVGWWCGWCESRVSAVVYGGRSGGWWRHREAY
jgi:hypothetical protein